MNFKAFLNTITCTSHALPIVILYVTEGCNLRCNMCSYRDPLPNELSFPEIEKLAHVLHAHGLRRMVYSGGEPLLRRDFPVICNVFKQLGIKQTLVTNGLLLEKRLSEIYRYFTEIIVSLDGARAGTHNAIRGVESFDLIIHGIRRAVANTLNVSIRTVLQKQNFKEVLEIVDLAKSLGVHRISFLSADVLSESFGREDRGKVSADDAIMMDQNEVGEFRVLIDRMVSEYTNEFRSKFISESPGKMYHLVQYYEALIGKALFPRNYCNAPMVSAVITSTGDVQPCFFLPTFGNLRQSSLNHLLNSDHIKSTRQDVRAYTLERCQKCVCTLNVPSPKALFDQF
ncbi:MAG: radical SAM protein [Ignavibacteria bacterium]|nr:radical SAM protein [Ignavibacteria bacterium]